MSSIVGFYNKTKANKKDIVNMSNKLAHRGTDGENYHIDENFALGFRRMSTSDLKEPIYNDNKNIVIVYDGFINNYDELSKELVNNNVILDKFSKEEILLKSYEKWGYDLIKKLKGMFSIAIWNKETQEVFLARDKWGIKPIYYYKKDDTFLFASETKAFLEHPEFVKEFNSEILASYLCFNSVPTEETFFKNVKRIEPGHQLLYKDSKIIIERYFKIDFKETKTNLEESVNEINEAIKKSVDKNFKTDLRIGSLLSSGVDSSYIVSVAKPDKTFTVGYDEKKYDELSYAKDLAEKLGIENISTIISKEEFINKFKSLVYYMDEPLADPSIISLSAILELASKHVDVITSGEGADELFGGYNSYKEEVDVSWYMKIPYPIRKCASLVASIFPEARGFNFIYRRGQKLKDYNIGLGRVFRDDEARKLVNFKKQLHTRDIVSPFYEEYKNNSSLVQRQVIDYYFWLVRDFLHGVERFSSLYGIECRTPFLDEDVYEIASQLTTKLKINNTTTKVALREAASKVIPNESYKRKKIGFPVPLREWVKEDILYESIKEEFSSDEAKMFFDNKKINKLLNDHKDGKKDCYKKIWTIYTFLLWYKQYFK